MKISDTGIDLLTQFEGFPNGGRPYNDPVGLATVGYGHLIAHRRVNQADRSARWLTGQRARGVLTQDEAKQLLHVDIVPREEAVTRHVRVPLTQGQFDALVSFVYNVGEGSFATSTALRRLNQRDYHGAADALLSWNKAGSPLRVLAGLTTRRRAERARFLAGGEPAPQAHEHNGGTVTEQHWITEYDRLTGVEGGVYRRNELRESMTRQRKRIWRLAQPLANGGDGQGWEHLDRRGRYAELLRRTR